MGTLMPTPRVSVPQMTVSRPSWASLSTSRRYLGSIPAWWTPMPWRRSLRSVLPKFVVKRKPPISVAMAAFRSLSATASEVRAWACSSAAAWVKWTM